MPAMSMPFMPFMSMPASHPSTREPDRLPFGRPGRRPARVPASKAARLLRCLPATSWSTSGPSPLAGEGWEEGSAARAAASRRSPLLPPLPGLLSLPPARGEDWMIDPHHWISIQIAIPETKDRFSVSETKLSGTLLYGDAWYLIVGLGCKTVVVYLVILVRGSHTTEQCPPPGRAR